MTTSRRDFLVRSAVVLGLGTLVLKLQACGGGGGSTGPLSTVRTDVAALLPEGARSVAKAFAKAEPDLADVDAATDALFEPLRSKGVDLSDSAELGEALRASVTADFEAGDTREIKQWVLSLTELRLCALTR